MTKELHCICKNRECHALTSIVRFPRGSMGREGGCVRLSLAGVMLLSGGAPTTPIPSLDLCFCGAKPRSGLITRALLLVVSPPSPRPFRGSMSESVSLVGAGARAERVSMRCTSSQSRDSSQFSSRPSLDFAVCPKG